MCYFDVSFEGWRFRVAELKGRRIQKVRVSLIEMPTEVDEPSAQ